MVTGYVWLEQYGWHDTGMHPDVPSGSIALRLWRSFAHPV